MSKIHRSIKKIAQTVLFFNKFNNRNRKRVFEKFDDKYNFNYIGYVDQYSDGQQIVRGFTVSSSHEDNHYSVGKISDREIALVDRVDAIWSFDGSTVKHNWLVMAFKLRSIIDIPHFFIKSSNHETSAFDSFFRTNQNLKELELGSIELYSTDFSSRFNIYAGLSKSVDIQRLIPNKTARVIGAHFWPLSVECVDNVLYIYADNKTATTNLLETMLKCGLWFAEHLEKQIEQV